MAGAGDKGEFEYVVILDGSGNPVTSFGGTGGTAMDDDAAFTAGSSSFTPVGGIVTADSVDAGDGGAFAMLANRQQKVTLYDSGGVELAVGGGTQYTEGDTDATIAGNAILWEDAADTLSTVKASKPLPVSGGIANTNHTGVSGLGLVDASGTPRPLAVGMYNGSNYDSIRGTTTNGIEVNLKTFAGTAPVTGSGTATGALRVELPTNGTGVLATVGTVTTVSTVSALGTGTTGPMKAEDVAHSTGDMGIPAWGVRLDSPNATAAASGDYHYLSTDMVGGIRTALYETDFAVLGTSHVKKYYSATGAATDGIVWSPAAGKRWYVTDLLFTTSAAATVTLEDDKTGGDEVVFAGDFAANSGVAHHFQTPLFSGEDAADLIVTTSAGNLKMTVVGYEI